MTDDPARTRTMAAQAALRCLRMARTALAAAAHDEPSHDRLAALSSLHAAVADAELEAARLQR